MLSSVAILLALRFFFRSFYKQILNATRMASFTIRREIQSENWISTNFVHKLLLCGQNIFCWGKTFWSTIFFLGLKTFEKHQFYLGWIFLEDKLFFWENFWKAIHFFAVPIFLWKFLGSNTFFCGANCFARKVLEEIFRKKKVFKAKMFWINKYGLQKFSPQKTILQRFSPLEKKCVLPKFLIH